MVRGTVFFTDPLVTEFTISGIDYELFEGPDCSSLTDISDCGSPDTFTANASSTYWILVGDEATVETANFAEEECSGAQFIATLNCGDVLNASGDPTACTDPEATGCMIDLPGVWFEFDTDLEMPSFEITGTDFELFEGSCGSLVSISDCGTPSVITATPGSSYYILVSGSVTVDAAPQPVNDFCANATDLTSGNDQVTCCAGIEGIDDCGGQNSGVWFVYSPGADAVDIAFANVDMSGVVGIDVYSGDCSGLNLEDSYCGGPSGVNMEVPACGDDIYVHVTSSQGDCGSFSLSATDVTGCGAAEACDDVLDAISPSSGSGQICVTSCTQYSCDGGCASTGVWFMVMTDDIASYMEVIVNNASFDPVVSIFQGADCGSLTALVSCDTPSVGEPVPAAVNAMQTYFIEVGSETGVGGDFDVCFLTDIAQVQCSSGDLEPTRPEYPDEDPDGPYCPGETVNFCYTVEFTVDPIGQGNNCQWIQGIIPTIGGGWDLAVNPIDVQGPSGGWFWLDDGNVDHNVDSPVLELISTPNGPGLAYGNGGLSAGDLLPGGWWYVSPGGGAGCTNDGDPDTMWGLPAGCGSSSEVEFCFDLTVREISDPADCSDPEFTDLKVHIFTMADGQTGCWSNNSCAGDVPVVFDALMDCTSVIEVLAEDKEICHNGSVDILVETSDGSSAEIIVEVIDEGNTSGARDWTFTGSGVIPDVIENEGSDVEVVIYEAFALSPPSVCRGPIKTIEVIVYPEIEIIPDDPYFICYGIENEIEPEINGGTGGPYTVEWSNGDTGLSVLLPKPIDLPPGEYYIDVMVTDDLGCTGVETVEYRVLEPVEPTIIAPITAVCKDGVDDMISMTLEFDDVGTGPYDYIWDSTPTGLDFDGSSSGITVIIDEENSTAKTYTIFGTVTDDYGCEYKAETTFVIDNGPELELAIVECFGVGYDLSGYVLGLDPVTFELYYDEDSNWDQRYESLTDEVLVHGPIFGNNTTYFAEEFGQYILVGTSSNGCQDFAVLDVPPLANPIFSALPNDTICAGTTVTIKVDNYMEFVEFDWSTGSSVDSTVVTPMDTSTYYLEVELNNGCEIIDSIKIVVNPIPPMNITGSTSFCPGAFTTLTAQGDTTSNYLWTGPNGEIINTQSAQINVSGSWNILITTQAGCINTEDVLVTQNDELEPQIIGGNFCTGESVILDGGPGFDSYTWFDPGNTVLGTDPSLEVSTAGDYILEVFLGTCNGLDTFTVLEIPQLPDALSGNSAEVCDVDTGSFPTSLDLTSYENGTVAGDWFNENGIPIADPTFIDFTGMMPSSLVYTFVTTDAIAPCENDSYNFTININNCACPSVAINQVPDFCVGADTFDLSLIQLTTEAGSWSVDDTSIEILNNTILITNENSPAGDYTLTFTLDDTSIPANCDQSNSVDFSINASPEAEIITDIDVCNLDTGNGPDFIDLDDLYISGSTGDWSTNEAGLIIDANNVVSFTGQTVGSYDFFYLTNDAVSPCQNVNYTTVIDVLDCSCPQLDLDELPVLCSSGGTIDLLQYLENPDDEPGNWTIDGPDNTVLIGNDIDAQGAIAGDYSITFSFNTAQGGSCINEVTQVLTILDPPMAMITEQVIACNGTNISTFPVNIDLSSVVAGDDGIWTAPVEYNNGIIVDETNVSFEGVIPGIYSFVYTTNTATAPCQNIDVVLNLEVVNCNCPLLAFNTPSPLCNDGTETNLNTLLFPDVGEGVWNFVDGPETAMLLGDSLFVVNEITEGQYTFEYTLTEMAPAGCPESSQITLEVFQSPDVELIPQAVACNTSSIQGPVCLDLNTFVLGATGIWNAPANYTGDFSDISNVCFEGEAIGSTFEFVFLTNTAVTPCTDKRLSTIVTIIDCNCPNLSINTPPSICNVGGTLDLSTLEDPSITAGNWSVISGPESVSLNGTIFNAEGLQDGIYTLQYTPDETPPIDCSQNSQIDLEVVNSPDTGSPSNIAVCLGESLTIDLHELLEGEDNNGIWTEISQLSSSGNAFNGSGIFNTAGQVAGTYDFEYSFSSIQPCADVSSIVQIIIEDLPSADAGEDQMLSCSQTSVQLGGSGSSSGTNIQYLWTAANGSVISNPNALNISVEEEDTYTLQVTDLLTGCISSDDVLVDVDMDLPTFGADTEDSPCYGYNAGAIIISTVQGGDGNYLYSIDNGQSWSDQNLFDDLAPGTYTVLLQDGNGCQSIQSGIVISEPEPLILDAGQDMDVDHGDEYFDLQLQTSLDLSQIASIVWTENGTEICSQPPLSCMSIEVDPDGISEYCATIIDINGCVAEDCVVLRERVVRDVFIPNIFTPTSSDQNSRFYVHTDVFIERIADFRVYDRWGEMVFSAVPNHSPNMSEFGWDGTFNDRYVEQGVYVYVINVVYTDGESELFAGDVTVIR